jgi:hypothetical protein
MNWAYEAVFEERTQINGGAVYEKRANSRQQWAQRWSAGIDTQHGIAAEVGKHSRKHTAGPHLNPQSYAALVRSADCVCEPDCLRDLLAEQLSQIRSGFKQAASYRGGYGPANSVKRFVIQRSAQRRNNWFH